jgi:hypothetical protein
MASCGGQLWFSIDFLLAEYVQATRPILLARATAKKVAVAVCALF